MNFLVLALLFSTSFSYAKTLTWQDCVREASKNNLEIQGAKQTLESYENSIGTARSGFFPTLTATGSYSYGNSTISSEPSGLYSASLSATEYLFSGFQDKAKVDQAQANARGSEASLQIAMAKASYDLTSAYASLLYSQKSIKLQQSISERREENLKMVELRYHGGQENKGSVLLSRANLNQAHFEILQAKNGIQVYRTQMAKVLALDDENDLNVTEDFPLFSPPGLLDLKKLASIAPEYVLSSNQAQAADAAVTIARSGYFPTLSLTGTTTNQDTQFFPQSNHWSVGATLSFPLFSGLKDYYSTRSASATYMAAESNRMNVSRTTLTKLRTALSTFVEAVEKLKVDESYLKAAEARAEIARNKYRNGLLTFDAWDIIENDLIARQKAFLASQRDRVVAQAAWEQAQGKGVLK